MAHSSTISDVEPDEMNGSGHGVREPYAALADWLDCQRLDDLRRKCAEAEALFQRALAIRVEKLGENHALTSDLLSSLGDLYSNQARYAQAEATYRRMLAADEARLGSEDPEIAVDLLNAFNNTNFTSFDGSVNNQINPATGQAIDPFDRSIRNGLLTLPRRIQFRVGYRF